MIIIVRCCSIVQLVIQTSIFIIILIMSANSSHNSLKDKKQKQDVLKAILNVKKYTKTLKRNADAYSETNIDTDLIEISSSPSFFDNSKQRSDNQPIYSAIKDQWSETGFKNSRQKKEHSMTSMPSSKKGEEYSAFNKLKKQYISKEPSEVGSSRQGTYSMKSSVKNREQILSKSYKIQNKQKKADSTTKKKMMNSEYFEPKDQAMLESKGQKVVYKIEKENPEVIRCLLAEIHDLKQQISLYKQSVFLIKQKYCQLEELGRAKVESDQLIDVLKNKILELESNNQHLNTIIEEQNTQLKACGQKMNKIITQIMEHYNSDHVYTYKLELENKILKSIINTKSQQFGLVQPNIENQQKLENSEIGEEICFSVDEFDKKYKKGPQ